MRKLLYLFLILHTLSLSSQSDSAVSYYESGNSKFESRDFDGAIADYTKAIEISSDYADAYYRRGNAKSSLEYYQSSAIADYTKAIEISSDYAEYGSVYKYRGSCKNELEDYVGGLADLNKAIDLNPNDFDAINRRGTSKQGLKDFYGAIADYTEVIASDPDDPMAYYNRAVAKYRLRDYDGACKDVQKAVELGAKGGMLLANACK